MRIVNIDRTVDMKNYNDIFLVSKDVLFNSSFSKLDKDLQSSESRAVFVTKDDLGIRNSSNSVFLCKNQNGEEVIDYDKLLTMSLRMRPDVVFVEGFSSDEKKMIPESGELAFNTGHSLGIVFKGKNISKLIDDLKKEKIYKNNTNTNVFLYAYGKKWAVDLDS